MTASCLLILSAPKVGGRPVGSESSTPRDVLQDELEMLVRGRLLLILLPVRKQLECQARISLADAVEIGVRDVGLNIGRILKSYAIEEKT